MADEQLKPGGTYSLKSGETLYELAEKVYGDGNQWKKIAKANGLAFNATDLDKPEALRADTVITFPE